jgi:hypothetical protein
MKVREQHLVMEELLALRDGEGPRSARSHLEGCETCREQLERLYRVRAELRALPGFVPPRSLWPRVVQELSRRRGRRRLSYRLLGLAAAAVLAAVVVLRGPAVRDSSTGARDVWVAESASQDLGPIITRSQELESLLQVYRPEYRVYDAPTALAVSALEDRIVLIDRMLVESRRVGLERELLMGLWGERVDALEALVGLQVIQGPQRIWR